jgi:hypothetical protein
MWKGISNFALIIVFAFTCTAHAAVPDWVRQAASQKISTQDPEINAIVLLDELKYTILGSDDVLEHYRRVVKIIRKEGHEEGELTVWTGHEGKVVSTRAWSIDKAGREYELKEKDFAERTPYSYVLYDDVRMRTAQAPAAEPDSVVAFEYEVRRKAWLRQLDWFFQEENPVMEARFILQMPLGWEYKEFWVSASAVQPTGAEGMWHWTVWDVPAIKHEPRMPALASLAGHMEVSYFGPGEGRQAGDRGTRWGPGTQV